MLEAGFDGDSWGGGGDESDARIGMWVWWFVGWRVLG